MECWRGAYGDDAPIAAASSPPLCKHNTPKWGAVSNYARAHNSSFYCWTTASYLFDRNTGIKICLCAIFCYERRTTFGDSFVYLTSSSNRACYLGPAIALSCASTSHSPNQNKVLTSHLQQKKYSHPPTFLALLLSMKILPGIYIHRGCGPSR